MKRRIVALVAMLGLFLAACQMPAQLTTVVDIAAGDENFSTLVTAVGEAGLVETLEGTGPFTVFAPTNAAFEQALIDLGITVDELLASPDLGAILTYHVVAGKLMAADVVAAINAGGGTAVVDTVNGESITVELIGGDVVINGTATVIQTDLEADNGVVHVIDAVLLPPAN
jgi:uncharacterized surface protein with fasciclin (FAS1) repeats